MCTQPAEIVHLSLDLYVKPLELEFVFGFFRHKRISKAQGQVKRNRSELLFINRTKSVPGSLMVLVIADLIYYPFIYYPLKLVCKSCRFIRNWRNFYLISDFMYHLDSY